jgi:hypothetical protein
MSGMDKVFEKAIDQSILIGRINQRRNDARELRLLADKWDREVEGWQALYDNRQKKKV